MRKVYFLPNLITTGSLFCGLLAIMNIIRGQVEPSPDLSRTLYVHACWLILASAILDGLDGTVARWTSTSSSFGLNYDSLSDIVSFGVAPAFLMFAKLSGFRESIEMARWTPRVADAAIALFVICGALRLARFNVQVVLEERHHFTGLPIPAAAGMVISTFLVVDQLADSRILFRLILILMVVLSYLMISTIPFPSHKSLRIRERLHFNLLVAVIIAICVIVALRKVFELVVFLGFLSYIAFSVWQYATGRGPQAAPLLPKNDPPAARPH